MKIKYLVQLVFILCVSGCTALSPTMDIPRVSIAKDVYFNLLTSTQNVDVMQKITSTYKDSQHTLITQVQNRNGILTLVGLTPTGSRLFSITYDGKTITSWTSPLFLAPFDAGYVLADYELAALSVEEVRRGLQNSANIIEMQNKNDIERIIVNKEGTPVVNIAYIKNSDQSIKIIKYKNIERKYQLNIEIIENSNN